MKKEKIKFLINLIFEVFFVKFLTCVCVCVCVYVCSIIIIWGGKNMRLKDFYNDVKLGNEEMVVFVKYRKFLD
mgnify:CR=1 FL=1